MKNNDEEPKEYFERSILLVIIVTITALALDWLSIKMLIEVNPWGSIVAIPGLILTIQAIWLIVNPYAVVYEDRFEIKQNMIYNKQFYFLDTKALGKGSTISVQLIYNDGDSDRLPLLGMRASHKQNFKDRLIEKIAESVKGRDF